MSIPSISEESGATDLRRSRRRLAPAIDPAKLDRLPPHSTEAEQGVLGCCLWDPAQAVAECCARMKEGQEHFYDLRHQTIYDAIVKLVNEGTPPDLVLLQQRLKDQDKLDQVGGISYLSSLQDGVPSAGNLPYYLEILLDKATARRLIRTCLDTAAKAYEEADQLTAIVDGFESAALQVRQQATQQRTRKELVHGAIARIERKFTSGGQPTGICTGLIDLDKLTDGLHPGQLIVIAAFPSVGKSALAGNIADHAAVELKVPVGIFTLEMTGEEWFERMMAARARVNLRQHLTERDFPKLTNAAGILNGAPLFIEDESDLTIGQLRAKARRLKQQHGIGLWVVDYLQLLTAPDVRAKDNREQEVSEIGKGLKSMAKELGAPVIVLSQLNDDGKLRESRATGQHADGVWKLSRQEGGSADAEPMELAVEKQRNGSRGKVKLTFLSGITKFECAAPEYMDESGR